MTTYSILYNRLMSRPQEYKSQHPDKDVSLADASLFIFEGWSLVDCNPIVMIDWNEKTIDRIGFNESRTAFEVKERSDYGSGETNRHQMIFNTTQTGTFKVAQSFGGFSGSAAAAAHTGLQLSSEEYPLCLLDWYEKKLHHLIRDHDDVINVIQNYPDEPLGILTTYENMEL